MSKKAKGNDLTRPTDAELGILRVLWKHGPSPVRRVQEVLNAQRPTGYTTALKLMQIMHEKGLVSRDESQRTHVYTATVSAEEVEQGLVRDLIDRAFAGAAGQLVMRILSTKSVSRRELNKIRELLDQIDKGER